MIYPRRLHPGDTIGVIAPAGPPKRERVIKGAAFLEEMGLNIKYGKYIHQVNGYLAGTDEERLEDLHAMFADPEIKAIICACGGYGTGRIAANLDYELIKSNPKIFWGYSDITYLHTAIRQQTGLITFHGPMLASDLAKSEFDKLSSSLFSQLFEPTILHYPEHLGPIHVISKGEATGELVGGNLALLTSTLGTPYEIDTKGKILLIEDVDEQPYRIDSMLNQLTLSGKIAEAKGIIIGDFSKINYESPKKTLSLEQVFQHYFSAFDGPVMSGFKIGHCIPNVSVPLGVEATINTATKLFIIQPGICYLLDP